MPRRRVRSSPSSGCARFRIVVRIERRGRLEIGAGEIIEQHIEANRKQVAPALARMGKQRRLVRQFCRGSASEEPVAAAELLKVTLTSLVSRCAYPRYARPLRDRSDDLSFSIRRTPKPRRPFHNFCVPHELDRKTIEMSVPYTQKSRLRSGDEPQPTANPS